MAELFITKLLSSILQIILFALIPFFWWLITARKTVSFPAWLGLKKPSNVSFQKMIGMTLASALAFVLVGTTILYMLKGTETATSDFAGMGAAAIPAIIIYAIFNTALPEEILFRGFLLKRMQNKFGFMAANLVQSVLFALIHGAMFFQLLGTFRTVMILLFTGLIAFAMGYINEKNANGSILPSWFIHTVSNLFSGLASAFLLF